MTLRQLWCACWGHTVLMHFEPTRLRLKCGICGKATEGWEIKAPPLKPLPVFGNVVVMKKRA